jgi:LemA protein
MIGTILLIAGAVAFFFFCAVGWWIGTYNFFATTLQAIKTQWSNIVTEYERRVDLFLNLGNSVKSMKNHEANVFIEERITEAR